MRGISTRDFDPRLKNTYQKGSVEPRRADVEAKEASTEDTKATEADTKDAEADAESHRG